MKTYIKMQNVIEQATGAKLFLERPYISQKGPFLKDASIKWEGLSKR